MRVICVLFLFLSTSAFAQDGDTYLRAQLDRFLIKPLPNLDRPPQALLVLGHELFRDPQLSGNNNISCRDCHHPMIGTSDAIALAVGEGATFENGVRVQGNGKIIKRHSPALWNLGHDGNKEMFWDARVRIDRTNGELITPEPKLKDHHEITKNLKTALAAQTIFPLVTADEMLGQPGSNSIADLKSSVAIWDAIIAKLKKSKTPGGQRYIELFNMAFPNEQINAGHMGMAMASFISWNFEVNDTPLDRYLAGDNDALSAQEKRGLNLFMGKARCAVCHNGPLLTNQMVMNVGVPPLHAPDTTVDTGYRQRFAFKTPALRNIAKTAPYMHNGIYQNLEEVVEHYNDVLDGLYNFTPRLETNIPYNVALVRERNPAILEQIDDGVFQPFLRNGLNLSPQDKQDLLKFLEISLTSP